MVPPGIEPRASGLSRQCSATKLQHPPTTTSLSFPYIALLVRIIVDIEVIFAVYVCDYERILSFYHSIGSPIVGAHPGPKTDRNNLREVVVGGCRSLVAEQWRLKPEALGSIPGGTTFFLSLCRFKGLRTVTAQIISIGLRTWVSPVYRAPNAVIKAQDSFVITNTWLHNNKCTQG